MSNKNNRFSAKGYYIALALCAAAIGVSGYLYYRNGSEAPVDVPAAAISQVRPTSGATAATVPEAPAGTTAETTLPTVPAGKPRKTAMPVEGQTVAEYAMECLSYNETTRDWRVHGGLDLAAETGTPVTAAADGEVYTVYEDEQMGTTVVIRHDGGYTTHYASLAEGVPVKAGDKVVLGQTVGFVGNTALMESALGDHVCFRVTLDGQVIDPAEFLN